MPGSKIKSNEVWTFVEVSMDQLLDRLIGVPVLPHSVRIILQSSHRVSSQQMVLIR